MQLLVASLSDDVLSPATALAVLGLLAAGWGVSRSGAVSGWKSVAEARKERIAQIEEAQQLAASREASLLQQIAELEKRSDMTAVVARLDELLEAVNELASRWG